MDYSWLVPFLALFTLLAVAVFAIVSKNRVEKRRHDPNAPTSTLAKDGPQGGIDALTPPDQQMANKPKVEPVLE